MLRGQRWHAKPIENDQMTTAGFIWLMRHVLQMTPLCPGGSVLSFIDWRQWPHLVGAVESVNLRVQTMIVWDKESYGLGNGFRVQHELILHASKGTPKIADKGTPNVIRCRRDNNSDHPSPKPRDLMHRLLAVVSDVGILLSIPLWAAVPRSSPRRIRTAAPSGSKSMSATVRLPPNDSHSAGCASTR